MMKAMLLCLNLRTHFLIYRFISVKSPADVNRWKSFITKQLQKRYLRKTFFIKQSVSGGNSTEETSIEIGLLVFFCVLVLE